MGTILIVDDEPAIQELVSRSLESDGHRPLRASNAEQAIDLVSREVPDIAVLDWMMPGMNGVELARWLRTNPRTKRTLILMLTVRGDVENKLAGLEAGADDYMTKPFSPRELNARIRALLRGRAEQTRQQAFEFDGLRLDVGNHRVSSHGEPVELRPTEFKLLQFFMSHPGRLYTRGQILESVWGDEPDVEARTVDTHIRRLRKALQSYGHDHLIRTVRHKGYTFSAQPV